MTMAVLGKIGRAFRQRIFPDLDVMFPPEKLLYRFDTPEILKKLQCASDKDVGGRSEVSLEQVDDYLRFSGKLSKERGPNVKESGYAMMRTRPLRREFLKTPVHDLSNYDGIELLLRGDGRTYFLNIQCDSLMPDDLFQTFLPTKAGEWQTVAVRSHLLHFSLN